MKQTLEEAAREAAEDCYEMPYDEKLINMKLIKESFKYGAGWQANQSPWISVKDRLPELGDPVLIRLKDGTVRLAVLDTDDNSDAYFWSDNYSYETISGWDTTHWVPIPPLESNGNELKRKEK
ncbi:DUF551 domain-containing protein [Bacteroides faecis]|uniref:DUF551 domain-containing protein n=1 Tax=Bacteroides faecis TaxID=674529 RepID=UPI001863B515|nr:DUF551 domain-containing protein [Bacteroides faecis]